MARAGRQGNLTGEALNRAVTAFRANYERDFSVAALNREIVRLARSLAEQHVLRGYDAVQLATATHTNNRRRENAFVDIALVSADDALNAVVQGNGPPCLESGNGISDINVGTFASSTPPSPTDDTPTLPDRGETR